MPITLDMGVCTLDKKDNDKVVHINTRRNTDKPTYNWLTDIRVMINSDTLVRSTIAYLLGELDVDPITLQVNGRGYAIFELSYGLVIQNSHTKKTYVRAVRDKMHTILDRRPQYIGISGNVDVDVDPDSTVTLIYIL